MWLSIWKCSTRTDPSNILCLQLGQRRPMGTYYTVAPVQIADGSKVTSCVQAQAHCCIIGQKVFFLPFGLSYVLVKGPLEIFYTSKTNGRSLHGPVRGPNRTLNRINLYLSVSLNYSYKDSNYFIIFFKRIKNLPQITLN